MNQELTTTTPPISEQLAPFATLVSLTPEAQKRAIGWALLGNDMYNNELAIAAKVDALATQYPIPTDPAQIALYDEQRKELSRITNSISKERTDHHTWKKLEAYRKRRTAKEAEAATHLAAFDAALLPMKQAAEAAANAEREKQIALQQCRAHWMRELADMQLRCAGIVTDKIKDLYTRALEKDAVITPQVMASMRAQLTAASFAAPTVTESTPERQAIFDEVFANHNPDQYVTDYHTRLEERFIDFENAKQHKTEATAQAQYEADMEREQAQQTASVTNMAATLQGSSTVSVVAEGKALKRNYVLDMPETEVNAGIIMAAFTAHNGWAYVRVKQAFNLTVKQMADALGKMRTEGVFMGIAGINFKEVEKI